jgi:hypothetical protein
MDGEICSAVVAGMALHILSKQRNSQRLEADGEEAKTVFGSEAETNLIHRESGKVAKRSM